jgi:hypothetical protein
MRDTATCNCLHMIVGYRLLRGLMFSFALPRPNRSRTSLLIQGQVVSVTQRAKL